MKKNLNMGKLLLATSVIAPVAMPAQAVLAEDEKPEEKPVERVAVKFTDEALKNALLEGLKAGTFEMTDGKKYEKPADENEIFEDELAKIAKITISDTKLTDISDLEKVTNLTHLTIENAELEDIAPIAKLTKLVELRLPKNKIKDVKALEGLDELTTLEINDNNIADISSVLKLKKLFDEKETTKFDASNQKIEIEVKENKVVNPLNPAEGVEYKELGENLKVEDGNFVFANLDSFPVVKYATKEGVTPAMSGEIHFTKAADAKDSSKEEEKPAENLDVKKAEARKEIQKLGNLSNEEKSDAVKAIDAAKDEKAIESALKSARDKDAANKAAADKKAEEKKEEDKKKEEEKKEKDAENLLILKKNEAKLSQKDLIEKFDAAKKVFLELSTSMKELPEAYRNNVNEDVKALTVKKAEIEKEIGNLASQMRLAEKSTDINDIIKMQEYIHKIQKGVDEFKVDAVKAQDKIKDFKEDAKILNEKLEKIDKRLTEVSKNISATKAKDAEKAKDLEKLKKDLVEVRDEFTKVKNNLFDNKETREKKVEALEKSDKAISELEDTLKKLTDSIEDAEKEKKDLIDKANILQDKVEKLISKANSITTVSSEAQASELRSIKKDLQEAKLVLVNAKRALATNKVEISDQKKAIEDIEGKINGIEIRLDRFIESMKIEKAQEEEKEKEEKAKEEALEKENPKYKEIKTADASTATSLLGGQIGLLVTSAAAGIASVFKRKRK